jgi:hypothetical protein
MATKRKTHANGDQAKASGASTRSALAAARGIKTGHDFANLMSALMSDLIEGKITPSIGNATCNAGGKLLKVVEMQIKYGVSGPGQNRILTLTMESPIVGEIAQPLQS